MSASTQKIQGNLSIVAPSNQSLHGTALFSCAGLATLSGGLSMPSGVSITCNTDKWTLNTTTGATLIAGNSTVAGVTTINADAYFAGTNTEIASATSTFADNMFKLVSGNVADLADSGIYGQYTSSGAKYAGLSMTKITRLWNLWHANENQPTTTVDYTTYSPSTLSLGSVVSTDTTDSTSGSTGAVYTSGGVGITKALFITTTLTQNKSFLKVRLFTFSVQDLLR